MKTSRCGFWYSACWQRERCERQGSSPRCCGVCVLIRLVLLRSFWHFPSTPAPVSLSVSASSPGLSQTFSSPTRLSSILCWHRQAAPSVTRLINSCSPILSATAGRACALSHARSRTSSESKFPMQRQPVYTSWHVLKGFFVARMNYCNFKIVLSIPVTKWSDELILECGDHISMRVCFLEFLY